MSWESTAFFLSTIWVLVAAVVLIFFREFEDKIMGRVGLVLMVVACALVISEVYQEGEAFRTLRTTLLLTVGLGLFLTRMCIGHVAWFRRKKNSHPMRRSDDNGIGTIF